MTCARCGHSLDQHGRRGYGACRVNRYGGLAAAVEMAKACAVAGVRGEEAGKVIHAAMETKPCKCKRYRIRSLIPAAPLPAGEVKDE